MLHYHSNMTIEDPEDPMGCKPLEKKVLLKDATWMASAGAEVNVDTGLQLDFVARLRLGVAIPTVNRQELRARSSLFYATFGSSF